MHKDILGERFRQMDPEAESWPELEDIVKEEKNFILLGLATGPANLTDKRQINRKKRIHILIDVKNLISTCMKPSCI